MNSRRMRLSVLVIGLLGAMACTGSTPPRSPTPTAQPLSFSGSLSQNSPPFQLTGGAYRASWHAEPGADRQCYFRASVTPTDVANPMGGDSYQIALLMLPAGQASQNATILYGVPRGAYYVNVNSGCPWSVSIAPQQ